MNSAKFLLVNSFVSRKGIEPDTLVLGYNNQFAAISRELEWLDNGTNLYMVSKNNRVRTVDHNAVAVLTHNCKKWFIIILEFRAIDVTDSFGLLVIAFTWLRTMVFKMDSRLVVCFVQGKFVSYDNRWKCDMDKLGLELKMHHLSWQVLSTSVMNRKASILTTSHEEVASGWICKRSDRFIELCEVTCNTSFFDIKDSHRASLETARKQWQRWMSGDA